VTHVDPLRREDLPQYREMFDLLQERAGFVPNGFLTMARRPAILEAVQSLTQAVFSGTVDRSLKSLVAVMSSYGAGCRYCQAHQAAALKLQGVADEKLAALGEFERSPLFSDAERAAMRLAFASGQHPNAVEPEHFHALREHFDEGEIVEIVAVAATFGFLNRWHETMATDLEEEPMSLAGGLLSSLQWEPGRHGGPATET
jgi:uncharacterized peroxidase-related enzyme